MLLAVAAAVALTGAAAAAGGGIRAVTVTSFPGVARSFDADAGRVAWIDSAWVLHVRTRRTGAEQAIRYTNPYEEIPVEAGGPPLALGVRRLAWLSTRGAGQLEDADHVYVAAVGSRAGSRVANAVHAERIAGDYVAGLAGDDSAFAYGVVTVTEVPGQQHLYRAAGGGVWTLAGAAPRLLPGAPPAIVLAESAGRIALAPVDTAARQEGTPAAGGAVEIRDATTGALAATLQPPGPVRAAAMTPADLDLLVGSRILRYDAASGALLGTTALPAGVAADLDASGGWIVFCRAGSVAALDVRTGRVTTIATTPWHPSGVALDGRTLAWAESRRIAAGAVSKKTFETRIRTAALPAP